MRWLLAAALALLSACATGRIPRVPGDPPPAVSDDAAERSYQTLLERSTSARGVYDNLESRLFVRATWLSPRFAAERVRREGLFKAWPKAELEQRLVAEQQRLSDATEFFFAVHANDYRFDDFDRPNTAWRMVLVVGGEELAPSSIERLGRTTFEMRSYYSYMENFWVGYRVRFPPRAPKPGETMTLKLASPMGQAELPYTAE